ncbi:hypothetical protein PUR61_10375 [Streptomyces sp. BE20]|uniref:hypothetical protein n=1 Tax=Streptomyces sp. BE20 TaxID=3002525 RepID=UPI002E769BF7|nr:hypothetical protein [Streptomyces sp. BE20]MEE1822593.1 hypothetical protein [Streptomyces sp. BE20]
MDTVHSGRVRVSGAVMTHPRRADLARELIGRCRPEELDLVLDPEPDGPPTGLRTAVAAWSSVPAGSTHHLVLQDDAVLTPGFFDHVRAAAEAAPDAALSFYTHWQSRNAAAVRLAVLSGHRWAPATGEYTPTVVLLLPAPVAAGFGAYAREHGATWADDVVMSRYLREHGVPTYLSAPNLADHADVPSMHANGGHGPRRAACFAPVAPGASWELDGGLAQLDAIPFFKHGRAQVATRLGDSGWAGIEAHRYLSRLGLDAQDTAKRLDDLLAEPAPGRDVVLAEVDRPALLAHWQTALLMGVVTATRTGAAAGPDGVLADSALATLGAGGLCTRFGDDDLVRLRPGLLDLARSGYAEGLAAGARLGAAPTGGGPARPARARRVVVSGPGAQPTAPTAPAAPAAVPAGVAGVAHAADVHDVHGAQDVRDADGSELAAALARALADGEWDVTLWGGQGPEYPGVRHAEPGAGLSGAAAVLQVLADDPVHRATAAGVTLAAAEEAGVGTVVLLVDATGAAPLGPVPGATVLRHDLVYGPGIQSGSVLEQAVRGSLLARPIRIPDQPGRRWRPVFVDDLAEAVDRALRLPPAEGQVDVRGVRPMGVADLAEAASAAVRPVPVEVTGAVGAPGAETNGSDDRRAGGPEDVVAVLGRRPRTELADGLRAWSQWLAYEAEPRPRTARRSGPGPLAGPASAAESGPATAAHADDATGGGR